MVLPATELRQVETSAGPIDYVDSGGPGPVLVFGHGVPMNETQWNPVVPHLDGYRCLRPTLPLGGHRQPMRPDADLTHHGIARLLGEFLERLDLHEVTLVLNDWGGGQFLLLEPAGARVARLVLVACEAFDNFPPPPARPMAQLARVPGGLWPFVQLMRLGAVRRAPWGYRAMTVRPLPDEVLIDWFAPATRSAAIRRDFAKFSRSAPSRKAQSSWFEPLRSVRVPVLVVWARQDTMMPPEHGPRLARHYPNARLVEIDDSATLVPWDQPEELARVLREFLADTGAPLA
ncbi:MAG: alpha/beta hydrolase [Austwickia sp.]|nr:alpha/beta hydrolase [Austwickia sp.]MCO5308145.1 alpha/beta hydrolase [Austwickia sp.]